MPRFLFEAAAFGRLRWARLALPWLLAACGGAHVDRPLDGGVDSSVDALVPDARPDDAAPDAPYLTQLASERDFDVLSGVATAGEFKYLARTANRPAIEPLTDSCYFQSARSYPWHLQFLQKFSALGAALSFDLYRELVVRESTRRMWGGTLRRWPSAAQPLTQAAPLLSYDVYAEPGGLTLARIAELDRTLKACAPFAAARIAFLASGADQEALVRRDREQLKGLGVAALLPSELDTSGALVAYSRGEAYGYLRVVPRGRALSDYGPRDVVVVESAPQDISIVAGLLTQKPQNELGHVNLRLREKAIPNASLSGVYELASVASLAEQLVHVVVSDTLTVEPARIEAAEAFWAAHRPTVRTPTSDLTRTALLPLNQMRTSDAQSYGAKCANLGELTRALAAPHRPDGFGIPFARYRAFAESAALAPSVDALLALQAGGGDAKAKRTALKDLRDRIRSSAIDAQLMSDVRSAIEAAFGAGGATTYLRFRSSTNVEDLDALTGAGLYDSKSGCLADDLDGDTTGPSACLTADKRADLEAQRTRRAEELREHPDRTYLTAILDDIEADLTNEKPVADALRKVWASLWNERAFDERAYYGIDHRLAFMGIAVHPTYALERANAVVVSNLKVDEGAPLYRINSQVGEASVVTPEDPSAVAEVLTFRRSGEPAQPTDIQRLLGSSLLPTGMEVWPRDKLLELAALLFRAHDHFAREVYPTLTPLSLDFEVKLERSGDVAIKQVRPFVPADP